MEWGTPSTTTHDQVTWLGGGGMTHIQKAGLPPRAESLVRAYVRFQPVSGELPQLDRGTWGYRRPAALRFCGDAELIAGALVERVGYRRWSMIEAEEELNGSVNPERSLLPRLHSTERGGWRPRSGIRLLGYT